MLVRVRSTITRPSPVLRRVADAAMLAMLARIRVGNVAQQSQSSGLDRLGSVGCAGLRRILPGLYGNKCSV